MRTLLRTAVALAAGWVGWWGCGVAAGQTVEFRIVEREGQTAISSSADAELNMAVQARVVGGGAGIALGTFLFNLVVVNEPDSYGLLERGRISNLDGTYATAIGVSSAVGSGGLARQYTFLASITPNFNGLINESGGPFDNTPQQEIGLITGWTAGSALIGVPGLDADHNGNPDTYPGTGTTAPLDPAIGAAYFGANGNWIDVYRFRYTATNLSTRTLRFELQSLEARTFTTLEFGTGVWGAPNSVDRAATTVPTVVTIAVSDTGACCGGSGCALSSGAVCAGSFLVGEACGPTTCLPRGSCCGAAGECAVIFQTGCTGVWSQGGSCTPNHCPQPGVCCFANGVCSILLHMNCNGVAWSAGGSCAPNMCAQPGACCGTDCQIVIQQLCPSGRVWMPGTCTPSPCPPPTACCNTGTGACSLVVAPGDVVYSYSYAKGASGYARNDAGGTVETIAATFSATTKRLVFDVTFSGATSGGPVITNGFWLVLDNGPNPKHHPGELTIFYFDATTLATPKLTAYAFNGASANTSWSDGDPGTPGDQAGDLIKGVHETSYINAIVAEDMMVMGQARRHLRFDIDASDIVSHVPLYPAASPWHGSGFDLALGLWLHGVGGFTASYESSGGGNRGGITSLATEHEGWLDAAGRATTDNDPCPSGSRITPAAACSPSNTCPQRRACCDLTNGLCVVVGPSEDCPTNFTFASPGASTCSPSPCPSTALQASGRCCNTLTGACYAMPLSCCSSSTHTWSAGGVCSASACPPRQGACCNVVTGGCAVSSQAGCGSAAHDWVAGGSCSPNTCELPGICCNTALGTCRRFTRARCLSGSTWAPTGTCSPTICTVPGRCCNVVTGACQTTLQSGCAPGGHDWMPGATCSPNPCAVPGVCCNVATGACRRFTEARCAAGSIWSATGACSPNSCELAGSCCNVVTGGCQMSMRTACAPGGHDWMPGGVCSPNPCDVTGACCNMATGACRRFTQDRCLTGSVWIASGVCAPSPCSMPLGACCNVVVGTCAMSTQSDCAPAAHDWVAGGSCSPNACALPAACCNAISGVCLRLTEVRCMVAGGTWMSGRSCNPSPCSTSLVALCAADFNGSGRADVQDVLAFLNAWFALDLRGDFNDSGEIDAADVFEFLTRWLVGCP